MDFHSELVKITEFQPLEDFLIRKKASELYKTSQSNKITVSINPSNLVELTRVGERFAPDSCVDNLDVKYILSNKLIPNKDIPTHFEQKSKSLVFTSYEESKSEVTPIIPNLIIRQRPGISYQPIKETPYFSVNSEPSFIEEQEQEKPSIKSLPTPGTQQKVVRIPSSNSKALQKSSENISVTLKPQASKPKSPKKISTLKPGKVSNLPKKKLGKKRVKTILKKSNSEEVDLSSNSERKTVTWEEDEKAIKTEHEAKRKQNLDKYKYQVPSYLKDKETNAETLGRLERIVEEEKELLRDKGIITPESSQGSKYKKTYEELEKEIQNIREMLSDEGGVNKGEGEEEEGEGEGEEDEDYEEAEISEYEERESEEHEEGASIDYCYSSDDCKEDKAWMKPRFK